MTIKYWSGLIIPYRPTKDGRRVPLQHRILFPLKVPVLMKTSAYENICVGKMFGFQEQLRPIEGVRANVEINTEQIPVGLQLYIEVDIDDISLERDEDTYLIVSGVLAAAHLGQYPAWDGMAPVFQGRKP